MPQLHANFISTTLNGAISDSATTIVVTDATGMPSPTLADDFFLLTLAAPSTGPETTREIVKCTARTGTSLTVVRAQEGTTAVAWADLDKIELRETAGLLNSLAQFARSGLAWSGTVLAITGALTLSAASSSTDTTLATSATTGAMIYAGGVGINIADTTTNSGRSSGVEIAYAFTHAGSGTCSIYGVNANVTIGSGSAANTTSTLRGGNFSIDSQSGNTANNVVGVVASSTSSGAGGTTTLGGVVGSTTYSGGGTCTTLYSFNASMTLIGTQTVTVATLYRSSITLTSGTVTTLIGLSLPAMNTATMTACTTIEGIVIGNLTGATAGSPATNVYMLKTGNATGGSNNYQLNMGTGLSVFSDTTLATSATTGSMQLLGSFAQNIVDTASTSGNIFGIYCLTSTTTAAGSSGSYYGLRGDMNVGNGAGAYSGSVRGIWGTSSNASTSSVTTQYGGGMSASATSTGGGTTLAGSLHSFSLTGGATWTNGHSIISTFTINHASAVITTASLIGPAITLTAGKITNLYGLNLPAMTCTSLTGPMTLAAGINIGAINAALASSGAATNAYAIQTGNVTGASTNYQQNMGTGLSVWNDTTDATSATANCSGTFKGGIAAAKKIYSGTGVVAVAGGFNCSGTPSMTNAFFCNGLNALSMQGTGLILANAGNGNAITTGVLAGYLTGGGGVGAGVTAVGAYALSGDYLTPTATGDYNTAIGAYCLAYNNSATNALAYNTAIGAYAGSSLTQGSHNVLIGYFAGRYSTTQVGELFVNSYDTGSRANDLTNSLIYGNFASTVGAQSLRVNGALTNYGSSTVNYNSTDVSSGVSLGTGNGSTVAFTAPANYTSLTNVYLSRWGFTFKQYTASRTNLCLQSQDFNTTWTKNNTTVTVNSTTAPDGTSTADSVLETAVTNVHNVAQTITISNATAYVLSVYVKPSLTRTFAWLQLTNMGGTMSAYYNLSGAGSVSNTVGSPTTSITALTGAGAGWYLITISGTSSNTSTVATIGVASAAGTNNFAGNTSNGLVFWQAQLEALSAPGLPVLTTTGSASATDLASISGATATWNTAPASGDALTFDATAAAGYIFKADAVNNRIYVNAPLVLAEIASVTTEGSLVYDSTQKTLGFYNDGLLGWTDRTFCSNYNTNTQTGIVTSASAVPSSLVGSRTLPANWWAIGKRCRFIIRGYYTTGASGGNLTVVLLVGGTTFRTISTFALPNNATNCYFRMEGAIVCHSTGGTGTVGGILALEYEQAAGGGSMLVKPASSFADVTIDTTASALVDLQVTTTNANTVWNTTDFLLIERA